MNKFRYIFLLGVLLVAFNMNAQNQSDMRLNEVLVTNTSDFQDDFGQHSPWIELFNISYGTVNIGGCYLSNDPNNLQLYRIPKGDVLTQIKPRQHTLFWADNQPKRGTFHLNFSIKGGDVIYFVSSDGKTIIDQITIPADIQDNISYGRLDDGIGSTKGDAQDWAILDHTSPSTNNKTMDGETKAMVMKRTDPYGIIMAVLAMSVVFLALIILYFIFKFIGNFSVRKQQKQVNKAAENSDKTVAKVHETSAETYAAIATALHLYIKENESHDDESFTLTMSHTDRTYSPWNSKIYGLRQTPNYTKNKR